MSMIGVAESQSQPLRCPAMFVSENTMKTKFKIKFASKILAETEARLHEFGRQVCIEDEPDHSISVKEKKKIYTTESDKVLCSSGKPKLYAMDNLKVKLPILSSKKRGPPETIDMQRLKRQKMDHIVKQQCSSILKTLMTHPDGWVFNSPVDPVTLKIPDYFSIITKPMDLGTIKSKLEANQYFSIEEFAADIRLTFSNAMLYNPPSHDVHHMAKALDDIFGRKWKILEAKLYGDCQNFKKVGVLNARDNMKAAVQTMNKISPFANNSVSVESEQKLRKVSVERDARAAKAKPKNVTLNEGHLLAEKLAHKGTDAGGRSACGMKPRSNLATSNCNLCGSQTCQCGLQNDHSHASNGLYPERSQRPDNYSALKRGSEVKIMQTSHTSKLEPDGLASAVYEENSCLSPQLSTVANTFCGEGWTPLIEVQLSPKKALRAAMLKSRFADTILKAKAKTLLDQGGDRADHVKLQQEKERLERQQREEKARIEAQIRAAETASRMKAEAELKLQREREREAARMALMKIEKTVEIDDNLETVKELEMLCGCSLAFSRGGGSLVMFQAFENGEFGSPLERLGLFIKEEYWEDENDTMVIDGEEGEIIS